MKNARRAAAAGHKTTQRRRRPPVRRRTALNRSTILSSECSTNVQRKGNAISGLCSSEKSMPLNTISYINI